MNRFTYWMIAVGSALALTTGSLEAAPKKHGKGGKHHAAAAGRKAPKHVARAPAAKHRSPVAKAKRQQSRAVAQHHRAPQVRHHARAGKTHQRSVAKQRSVARAQHRTAVAQRQAATAQRQAAIARQQAAWSRRHSPSVAFGGVRHSPRTNITTRNYYYNPPAVVYRDWDRGRIHWWNNHRYHWANNAWVILNAPAVTSYFGDYEDANVTASVQAALNREGYDAGPVDGVLGGETRDAIADYQSDHGMDSNGEVTDALLRSLDLK